MLNSDEKKYLWSKIEYTKKKKATESENDLYKLLNTDMSVNEEDFIKILNSLEYSFKKKLKEGTMNNDTFKNIQNKLPKDFVGVKYSNLEQQKKKLNKKPTINSTKAEIIEYLKNKKIDYKDSMKKSELLDLFENNNILTFKGFNKLSS